MSLRLRLTLLYASLIGGMLILFGFLVYILVSVSLLNQVDRSLLQSAAIVIENLRVDSDNAIDQTSVAASLPGQNILFQVWDSSGRLSFSQPPSLEQSLDSEGEHSGTMVINTVTSQDLRLRVLSMPVSTTRGPAGILQVALSLTMLETTQLSLITVLSVLTIISMVFTALITWFLTKRTLSPLEMVTRVAAQITNADDLSRRIPLSTTRKDEVGALIQSFNNTLERLETLFNSQRRFLADVSHDLRTPLTVIKGNVGIIRKMKKVDLESLASIEVEVDRLTRLVGDLLLLAQAESGRMPLQMKNVELDTLLLEVFQQMKTLAGDRLNLTFDEIDQVIVPGDHDRLKQVFVNLLGNAVQYTPSGGSVSIALRKTTTQANVIIKDTGPGIPASDLPHIFERFFRGERSRRRNQTGGFGLGLSIAYWIIRNHRGVIEVSSQEGQGTSFAIWLPLVPAEEIS